MAARWRGSRRTRAATIAALAILTVLLTWYPSPAPGAGFDPSWQIALHLIAARGLDYGHDVVFTYGPLGFTLFPQTVTGATWAVAFVVTFLLRATLVFCVIGATRRATGHLAPALVTGYVCAAALGPLVTIPGMLAALVAVVVIQQPIRLSRHGWTVPVALGAGAAWCLLVKLDGGVLALVALGCAAWFQGPRGMRAIGAFAGGWVVAFVAGWLATGNAVGDIGEWLVWSRQMVAGYTGGAALTDPRVGASWHFTVFFAALAIVVVGGWLAWRRRPRPERWALALVVGFTCWIEFKHGFVRHDTHVAGTLLVLGLLPLTFRWSGRRAGWLAVACSAVGLVGALNAMDLDPWTRLAPTGTRGALREARMLVDPARRDRAITGARAAVRHDLPIDQSVLDAVDAVPLHLAPQETSVVWAYDLAWQPIPQFQSFSTWTSGLDDLNATRLAGPDGPPVVLRQSVARLDRHNPLFESPRENLALMCSYRQVRMVGRWEVLRHTADRCGPERRLSAVDARAGETIAIPPGRPDELVYARVRWRPGVGSRLVAFVYRPPTMPEIALPEGPSLQPYRIPGALLDGPLLLAAPQALAVPGRLRQLLGGRTMRLIHMDGAHVEFFARRVTT